jgi:hypothetical protein
MIEFSSDRTESAQLDVLCSLFEQLRPSSELTPSVGFYNRVLRRIEKVERQSIWVPFIYSRSYPHVAAAFLVLSLVVLGYVVAIERSVTDAPYNLIGDTFSPTLEDQRDAVLMQILAHSRPN